jgi:hypothetical protein
MQCSNCGNKIPPNLDNCPYCLIFLPRLKTSLNFDSKNRQNAYLLVNEKFCFSLAKNTKQRIIIGRKDQKSNPDIDLGPFDADLSISRQHGVFSWKIDQLFYEDTSRNGTKIQNKIINKKKLKLNNHDILYFLNIKGEIILN